MATAAPTTILSKLNATQRRFCQILAVADEEIPTGDLSKLYKSIDWPGRQAQAMTVAEVQKMADALAKKQVLSRGSYSSVAITSPFQSVAVQTAIHDGTFEQLCQAIQTKYPRHARLYSHRDHGRASRDMRIAFYNGDADELSKKSRQLHAKLRTKSLIDLADPVPHWQQALAALRQLSGGEQAGSSAMEVAAGERMIWDIDFLIKQSHVEVRPIIQKRSGGGWTKGRPVSLERLYQRRRDAEFAFLTEQDHAICNALDCQTDRNDYGYTETCYFFNSHRLVIAIIGHPRLFRQGDRENPIEVAQQQPQLIVKRTAGDKIALSLEPAPTRDALDEGFQLVAESNDRLGVIFFTKEQLKLHTILNGSLTVPESAERLTMESIGPLASLISIHSEVDAGLAADQTVAADPSPHLHAVPYDAGLQLTFHVRPFGTDGPFFTTGAGAETVVARIGNQAMATRRDLDAEQELLSNVIADCPSISVQLGERNERIGSETIYLPTAEDSLQVLLELEDLVVQKKLTLHWPRGQKMQLAGHVSGSDFRLNIKRDRDWFAASGELKVDKETRNCHWT